MSKLKNNRLIISNIFQMSSLRILSFLFPAIMLPYLTRTLGVTYYGMFVLQTSLVTIFLIIGDYAFDYTATQKFSISNRVDNTLVSTIYFLKGIFALIIFLGYAIWIYFFADPKLSIYFMGFFLQFIALLYFPTWLFRGLEKLWILSFLNLFSNLILLFLTFTLIKSQEDFYLLGVVNAVPALIMMIISQFAAYRLGVRLKKVTRRQLLDELKEGKELFFSNAIGLSYSYLNPIILKIFSGYDVVGIYGACEKAINIINGLTTAVVQAIYPLICRKMGEIKERLKQIKLPITYFGWYVVCTLIGGFVLFFFSAWIISLIVGPSSLTITHVTTLRAMAFIPFFASISRLMGVLTLIPLNMRVEVRNAVTYGAVFNLIVGSVLAYYYGATGLAISVLLCEVVVITRYVFVLRNYVRHEGAMEYK